MTPEQVEELQAENAALKMDIDDMSKRILELEKSNANLRKALGEASTNAQQAQQDLIFMQGKIQAYEFVFTGGKNNG